MTEAIARVTRVVVAAAFADGYRIWTGTYPNATKKQTLAYGAASAPAKSWLSRGYRVTLTATDFVASTDVQTQVVVPA